MFSLRWWHVCMTDMSGPGPAFSWSVLVAILGFGLVALGLLTAGQFVRIGAPAVGLAIGTVLIGMARAASTVRERLRESELQAVTDPLTGLGNRRHLLDQLDAKIAEARSGGVRLALLLIDLDGFKELNDTLGHYAGDEVLRQIGPRSRGVLREDDRLADGVVTSSRWRWSLATRQGERRRVASARRAGAFVSGRGRIGSGGRERRHRAVPRPRPRRGWPAATR